jgi:outer membrane protein assembly factor BamB
MNAMLLFRRTPAVRHWCLVCVVMISVILVLTRMAAAQPPAADGAASVSTVRDPYKDLYADYVPDFLRKIETGSNSTGPFRGWKRTEEEMQLSTEPTFFALTVLDEDSRANALVAAGLKKEQEGQYREALKIYQQVIEKYPQAMYRVSRHGVFVPVSQYCQRRILGFPPTDLAFYRSLYDAQAREAFEQARRQYSLLGLSDIVDQMLATSFGGQATLELGDAALDSGYYLAALEHFTTVRDFFPDAALKTAELQLKIAYCEKMLGSSVASPGPSGTAPGTSSVDTLQRLQQVVASARSIQPPFHSQSASAPHVSADDYTLLPPTSDPLGVAEPTWREVLPGSRHDFFVYTQPTVTPSSVIYRHKNIVYCRSILNGLPRWTYDVGGRANWQNWQERQYPQEDVLVQDGLVFTTISKAGPSLVALDEVTGQLKWAYGPMVAATDEEARLRFESAPAGGPRTVFAGYVLDNIEGETHTDTEYGIIALDSTSGRVHWRAALCRLAPGKFSTGLAQQRRNRILSFTSPPLYHQGTVYYNTNAGAVAALDALSGRVKWLMRYPYYPDVHDATRQFGRGGELVQHSRVFFRPHSPMFWYNQRPLLIGERLLVPAVDSNMLFCLDRRTGRALWTKTKDNSASAYLLGTTRGGQIALAYTGRKMKIGAEDTTSPVHLLDPADGRTVWQSPDLVMPDDSPVMKHYVFASPSLHFQMNESWFEMSARPQMTSDGRVFVGSFRYVGYPIFGFVSNMACLDLERQEIVDRRRYYSGEIMARADADIHTNGPEELKAFEEAASRDEQVVRRIQMLKEVIADSVPGNEHGPFLPFSRVTFERYGVPFELRIDARGIAVVYDRRAVGDALAARSDPEADFARAELAIADARLDEAATLLQKCLATISSEDLDFRASINQQLYRVHQELVRRAIRTVRPDDELDHCLGMGRTAETLPQEIETLLAASEAFQRRGDLPAAAQALRTLISAYGRHEFPTSPLVVTQAGPALQAAGEVIDRYRTLSQQTLYGPEMTRSQTLLKQSLPLYLSSVSPLPKTLTVRVGELAAARLVQLQQMSPEFAAEFRATAQRELTRQSRDELLERLWEFPATPAAQQALEQLLSVEAAADDASARARLWTLADAARVGGLSVPQQFRDRLAAPVDAAQPEPLVLPQSPREHNFADEDATSRLVLERRDDCSLAPHLLFLGSQVRKRLDNKFVLTAMDLTTGRVAWETDELRLKGKGQEPGFFEAFVYGDLVLVHGLYDVLAFALDGGTLRWRYQVPFDFEIRSAAASGDLLILSGATETLALYVPTDSPNGEVAWQQNELGDLYTAPYMHGDRWISVRKMPFNVTVRYRATGRLIGRLDVPDLSLQQAHPLLDDGPASLPAAHFANLLVVTDGRYYILIDTSRLAVVWKRLIDNNDVTRDPPLRFALSDRYLAVLKEDYQTKAMYLLSVGSGDVLWRTDPKDLATPQPMHSLLIQGDTLYGIQPHAGQGFYSAAYDAPSGRRLFRTEFTGYQSKPAVSLLPQMFDRHLVAVVADRQNFELRALDAGNGQGTYTLTQQGVGPVGVHGHVSLTVQNGRLVLLSKDKLSQ